MKIIQVLPYFCFGGAEIMCENLTYALKKLGHTVKVVCLYDEHTPISDRMEATGISVIYLDKKLGLDVSMVPKLQAIFREEQPDIVHTHLDVIKYAVPAAKLAGVKRCVHTVHNMADKEAEGKLQKLTNAFFFRCGWSVPVALSYQVQKSIFWFYGLKETAVPTVYNGIDLSRCVPKASYELKENVTLVHIGRFTQQKNHPRLLEAFAKLYKSDDHIRLILVGDGEERAKAERLAAELGVLDAVQFVGVTSDVHPYLRQADVFVLPSDYEGMPMTIIEAMGTGLPIVATAVGGVPDMICNEKSGLLVPCDSEAVAEACGRLLCDEGFRKKLGQNALLDSTRFSALTMASNYLTIYQN